MSEPVTFRPIRILRCLIEMRDFFEEDNDFDKLNEREQTSIMLAATRFVNSFIVLKDKTLPGIKPLASHQDDPVATYIGAMSFLQGEMALQSVEDQFLDYEYEGNDCPIFHLYLLDTVKTKAPELHRAWQNGLKKRASEFLQELSHDEFMNDWTNWQ